MIEYRTGNIANVTSGVVAHGCNAQGVMRSGVALAVRNRWPRVFDSYKHFVHYQRPLLGKVDLVKINDDLLVANCITQVLFGREPGIRYVSYVAVTMCFEELRRQLAELNTDYVINIPRVGAGLGGGKWEIISKLIEAAMPNHRIICWDI